MKVLVRSACVLSLLLGFTALAQTIPGSNPAAGETSTTTHVLRYKGTISAPQGVVNLTFSLYATETGGTAVWSETQNVTVDNAGNFSALIGAGTTGGLPEAIFLTEAARWLGVSITGQAEGARVLLVSVPYAMTAVEAQRLAGHDVSEFVLQSQLKTGTTGGALGSTTSGGDAVTPTISGTAKFLSKFTAPDSLGDSVIYQDDNGNIGIGTTTIASDSLLQVAGRLRVQVDRTQSIDQTTSVATFSNSVTPTVDQTGSHQSFISNVAINGSNAVNQAVGGLFEADQFGTGNINQLLGAYGTVYVGNAAAVNQAIAFNNDAFAGFGTTQNLVGLRTSANTSKDGGSNTLTVNQIGVLVDSNTLSGGSVTNNFGLLINDQAGVGTNNWAIKTGSGLVSFGDRTLFAAATANRSSLNIPLGSAPSSASEGDLWNQGGAIKFVSGGSTKTLATTADLAGTATSADLTTETNARTAADTSLNNSITTVQSSVTALDAAAAKLAGNNTFTATNDFSGAAHTSPMRVVTLATTPSTCTANKELIVISDAPAGQQMFLCNSGGNGWNLIGGDAGTTVSVPANSMMLGKGTCSSTYSGTYPTVPSASGANQDIPIPPTTGTLSSTSRISVTIVSSGTSATLPAGWTSYLFIPYIDQNNRAYLHVCNPTQNNVTTLSGGSAAITLNVRAIN